MIEQREGLMTHMQSELKKHSNWATMCHAKRHKAQNQRLKFMVMVFINMRLDAKWCS